jgi:hypothetical protein
MTFVENRFKSNAIFWVNEGEKMSKFDRRLTRLFFACLFLLVIVGTAWSDDASGTSSKTPWWQVVSGIIAIPVAILGGWLTWKQIRAFKERKTKNGQNGAHVAVMNGATIKGSKVGNISGIDTSGNAILPEGKEDVSVLNKGQVRDSEVGDITGIRESKDKTS